MPRFALALAALLAALAASCATTAPVPSGTGTGAAAPWELLPATRSTQHLFRLRYDGPEGEGSLRLALRLEGAERYQVRATDPLGRALWTLDTRGDRALWLDHRNRLACTLAGRFDPAAARLTPFPLPALPALLLGRLPAPPAGRVERPAPGALSYRDDRERRWTVRLGEGGGPRAWTLWSAGEPAVWWRFGDGEAVLSDRRRGVQLRWRRTLSEPLAGPLEAVEAPAGFRRVDCARAYAAADAGDEPETPGPP